MRPSHLLPLAAACAILSSARGARAGNVLSIVDTKIDPPTVITLGVQVLISGDDNRDATIDVRYRKSGDTAWKNGLTLWRVPESTVQGRTVPAQFAGSIFDLAPGQAYDLELHAKDPDGFDMTWTVNAQTRPVPKDPANPHMVNVTDTASLNAALSAAKAGDVITLANGTYGGQFVLNAGGTADAPIVIRGQSQDGVILDGQGCTSCNVVEMYGDFTHLENLTIAHATRAIRPQKQGAEGIVVRRVHILDTQLGMGAQPDQKDFYICDNKLEGRLVWPQVWGDDSGVHANDDGIQVMGTGHVVCHNDIGGYGDAMKTEQDGARGVDFYGNEVRYSYDNAIELDGTEGNSRAFRNRLTNVWSPISFQPIYGGPAYAIRNVVVNLADEQAKLHSEGSIETVGALLYHNTWVSPNHALELQTSATAHYFVMLNNIYYGPAAPPDGKTVDWSAPIDHGVIDWGGFYTDGFFDFGAAGKWQGLSAMQSAGVFEQHGIILDKDTFASGLVPPPDYKTKMDPPDATLAASANAIDQATVLANISDAFSGKAPDLGALEKGCPAPIYGVRPAGMDESNEPIGCASQPIEPGDGGPGSSTGGGGGAGGSGGSTASGGGGSSSGGKSSGCGCRTAGSTDGSGAASLLALAAIVALRRRSRAYDTRS